MKKAKPRIGNLVNFLIGFYVSFFVNGSGYDWHTFYEPQIVLGKESGIPLLNPIWSLIIAIQIGRLGYALLTGIIYGTNGNILFGISYSALWCAFSGQIDQIVLLGYILAGIAFQKNRETNENNGNKIGILEGIAIALLLSKIQSGLFMAFIVFLQSKNKRTLFGTILAISLISMLHRPLWIAEYTTNIIEAYRSGFTNMKLNIGIGKPETIGIGIAYWIISNRKYENETKRNAKLYWKTATAWSMLMSITSMKYIAIYSILPLAYTFPAYGFIFSWFVYLVKRFA